MLLFLATILEQLDLSLEHISKGDVHNCRFSLMLTDNAVELILHKMAKDKSGYTNMFSHIRDKYPHKSALAKALGKSFEAKVKFAKLDGNLSDASARTFNVMHEYRNEIYHIGLQHEAILPALARFYLDTACTYMKGFKPNGLGWGSNQKMPERAKKYFKGQSYFPGSIEEFESACTGIATQSNHDISEFIAVLADDMDDVVSNQDTCIGIVAEGPYANSKTTRDLAVVGCQTWPLAFSEEGQKFGRENGYAGNRLHFPDWLAKNYPISFKTDPIPSWEQQAARLRKQTDAHVALDYYHSFMTTTTALRDAIYESAGAVEREIDHQIDIARGK
jgi:hypothetical protein